MKKRPEGFLSEENISHESDIFDYVSELHGYLWRFVRAGLPGASGDLEFYLDAAINSLEAAQQSVQADALPGSLCCEYFRKTGYLHSEGCAKYVRR